MSTQSPPATNRRLINVFEVLLAIGMIFMALGALRAVLDRPGLGIYGDTLPSVEAQLANTPEIDGRYPTIVTDDGEVVDAATAQAPVQLGEPVSARLTLLDPTPSQRAIWVLWTATGPLLALAGTWLIFAIVREAANGDPFIAVNEQRLWTLAAVIAVGGTAFSLFSGAARTLLIQRSAAADDFEISFSVSFLPIVVGIGVAVLASVWHVGVGLRDDVEGMV